jgi:glycosyltransferase involved in cell wall biosynthesis
MESMTRPTLALCIPAFNAAQFLPRLLRSAASQRIPFDEILVYDDCSTDDTAAVAESLGATVVRGERNVGCSSGKNRLAARSTSEWIHFHDADDDLTPEFTELAHRWMARPSAPDVVLFNYDIRMIDDGRLAGSRRFDSHALEVDAARYAIRNQINPYCGLYRRDSLLRVGGYDEDQAVLYNEDCRFHMRLAFAGLTFGVESAIAVINLERSGSMSRANSARCAVARLHVLEKAAVEAPPRLYREIALEAWLAARHLASHQRWQEMRRAVRLARHLGARLPSEETTPMIRWLSAIAPAMTFRARAQFVSWRNSLKTRHAPPQNA